ncbi:NADPH-dependent ferric siderophore reductase [Streptomyces agglomeratus]|uniref:NADPH-dependent ferric siderophore reductase n=1 Tax=Streptomyces agglomeratus TaxID=285458 RepID=A0A1E5PBD1_9ACTN|nr:siderophore-interacting protein [Streptomyces agglomeratus]OEJ26785.1 NADPH-dependent ferric siderophore reductase [Streptomyces agglomeratus]OEJ39157.1 NADPH-dependent ferric siderophore reductase [Streptomyces agglomeratus]OEJ46460.1 NADPH-dependent ferric siderophore reductase [Streptomyces agglomeratus]
MTGTEAAADTTTVPFRFFGLTVVRTRRLSTSLLRVTFGGEDLRGFASGGRDQSLSLFLPHPGQPEPVLPPETEPDWFGAYRALPENVRAVMRSYTLREQRRAADGAEADEVDIDFALHGDGGPASRWAAQAGSGDRVVVLGPAVEDNTAVRFRPPQDTEWVLIWADETALPAAAAALEWLPAGTKAKVWIEVQHADDRLELSTAADADITWLVRDEKAPTPLEAVSAAELPGGTPYTWIAGESSCVRALRRHLVQERKFDRKRVTFVGYWRRGLSEEQLRERAEEEEA